MGVSLSGTLSVPPERLEAVRTALPEHIRLTRAEPGCLSFSVRERPDAPGLFDVTERFVDRAAFDAHQSRVKASPWAQVTGGLTRDYTVTED